MAGTNEQAAELVSRARVDLVRAGRVAEDGLVLADGNRAAPARDDSPAIDPSQPSPAQRDLGGRPGPHLGR